MGKIVLVLGGARSGKTSFAISLAKGINNRAYLATCEPLDDEMRERVRVHQEERGTGWDLMEEPLNVSEAVASCRADLLIIDCVTLWVSNLLMKELDPLERARELIDVLCRFPGTVVLVSNEVGLGIVPDNPLARRFRDIAGLVNQAIASAAHEVVLLYAGIPQYLKKTVPGA